MVYRSAVESDLDRILTCTVNEPISWADPDRYRTRLAEGHYRLDRTWIAEDGERILARAVWWGFPGGEHPLALDCIYVDESVADRVQVAAELLRTAHASFRNRGVPELPAYHVFLPVGWRDDPAVAAAVRWRSRAVAAAGLTEELERLRYEWTIDAGPPARSERLIFTPEPDDDAFLAVFRRVAEGSLDVATQRRTEAVGIEQQAREDMDVYLSMPGDRSWWRLAHTPDGELVGLAIPSANAGGPVVGYLGVVPEQRGRGYVGDILAEITHILAAEGANRILADTDTTNAPMARAFERGGYRLFAIRLVISEPPN